MKRRTLEDVAHESGYSPATVSRVMNSGRWVSSRTRNAVLAAARKLGYLEARRTVAIILPSLNAGNYFYGMLKEIGPLLSMEQFRMEVIPQDSLDLLEEQNFCGALSVVGSSGLERLWGEKHPIPLVCINTKPWHFEGIYSVVSNDEQGMNLLVRHLVELGHKRIGLLYWKKYLNAENFNRKNRVAAFQTVMRKFGLPDNLLSEMQWNQEKDIALRRLLDRNVTAIITTAEGDEYQALYYLKQFGLRVPEDISLAGWLHPDFSRYCDPPVTGIMQNYRFLAQHAVVLFNRLLHKEPVTGDVVVDYNFFQRSTTAPPNAENGTDHPAGG